MAEAAKRKNGRPTDFDPKFVVQARALAKLGLTDAQMAGVWQVHEQTVITWKHAHADFAEALIQGKEQADSEVAASLYRRATGYEHPAVKIFLVDETIEEPGTDGKMIVTHTKREMMVPYTERYPPDTTACIFWLKNRQPALWRDRVEVKGDVSVSLEKLITEAVVNRPGIDAGRTIDQEGREVEGDER